MGDSYQTQRSTVRRIPERGAYDRDTIHRILDEGMIAQVGFISENQPCVIPMVYVRIGEAIYLHGSPASRMMKALAAGAEVCITVTLVDGLVLARSAFHHSVNYRCVMVFGNAIPVDATERKTEVLRALSDHLIPGRWEDVRGPSPEELKRTLVLGVTIREGSAKLRSGPPRDEDADYALPMWAGEIPLTMCAGEPIIDPRVAPGTSPPPYATHYRGTCSS